MAIEETLSDERKKWDRPYHFAMYPKTVFKGVAGEQGKVNLDTIIVFNESEHRARANDGWKDEPTHAIAHYHQIQDDIGTAAAERAAADRLMSAKAQREATAAEEAHDGHLAEVPITPIAPKKGWQPTK